MASAEELIAAAMPAALVRDGARRTRELYRYLTPASLSSTPPPQRSHTTDGLRDDSPLTPSLIPFVQLVALRCDTVKAIVNVIDKDTMYFLAQVSKRGMDGPRDAPMFETCEDSVLMGCSSVPVSGRVCELTIRMHANETSRFPIFTVPDMSQDPRFANLDVVASGPKYKFYAGTPITTKEGVNIGSLAVMDTKPRDRLSDDEEEFLGETAAHIMAFLELNREAIEGRRARRMGYALNRFVVGRESLLDVSTVLVSSKRPSVSLSYGFGEDVYQEHETSSAIPRRRKKHSSSDKIDDTVSSETSSEVDNSEPRPKKDENTESGAQAIELHSHTRSFARAANLMREALELGDDGGVLFAEVSATADVVSPTEVSEFPSSLLTTSESTSFQIRVSRPADDTNVLESPFPTVKVSKTSVAKLLACSTRAAPLLQVNNMPEWGVTRLNSEAVDYFVDRYPTGRLWHLGDDGGRSSSDEIKECDLEKQPTKSARLRRRLAEVNYLHKAFPEAQQLIMVPLWNGALGRISSAAFVWSSSLSRMFSTRYEVNYVTSFCQTLMAECSRIDAVMADKQKSDFVGTISHELRSPLHGILASVEFLSDSELTNFQQSIIHTIDVCGKTLLDTINHVLDFSKINSFEKNWQTSNKRKNRTRTRARSMQTEPAGNLALTTSAPPLLQLSGVTDISVVLEEVVEGIMAGQSYIHNSEITDMPDRSRRRNRQPDPSSGGVSVKPESDAVEVLLDVDPVDWIFVTQPGAVRRIINNIFGNAVKYTTHGRITVRLELRESTMILRVTDTGKGISPAFLNSRLFIPFAQENALAPGTGLGLSICKSIITMLGGTIEVQSRINSGTTVEVYLPLTRPGVEVSGTEETPQSAETGTSSNQSAMDRTINQLRSNAFDCQVCFYRSASAHAHLSTKELHSVLEKYITEWFGLRIASIEGTHPDIVILEEAELQHFAAKYPLVLSGTALIILCSDATSCKERISDDWLPLAERRPRIYISKPCGPHKLAQAIQTCMESSGGSEKGSSATERRISTAEGETYFLDQMKDLSLEHRDNNIQIVVHATEALSVSQTSQNAQDAIYTPAVEVAGTENDSFPFPTVTDSPNTSNPLHRRRISNSDQKTNTQFSPTAISNSSEQLTPMPFEALKSVDPRMLIVDDNAINLKLLHTFLKKRKCTHIDSAENGAMAVDLFTSMSPNEYYDIVFMDVSMPVMNGFEATRAIRTFEEQHNIVSPAMIIALTGLASGRDQAEGFASGCDIYLTKPVSFKEVGRLLDNWAANRRRHHLHGAFIDTNGTMVSNIPSGGVTEEGLQDTL